MADVKISALPAASTPLAGTELVPIVQSGVTEQVTVANLTAGRTVAAAIVNVDANSASAAVRITQTGAGNALLVEDSTSPDNSPFVVDASGNVGLGTLTPTAKVDISGSGTTELNVRVASISAASSPLLSHRRDRNSAIVNNGDTLGRYSIFGFDGSAYVEAARITTFVDGAPSANDMPGRMVFSTTADGASSTTERMRIDSAGNVRIGTAALATTATNGFLYVPTCAGAPTGVPTAITGLAPIIIDTTNNKLYFYSSNAWRDAGP